MDYFQEALHDKNNFRCLLFCVYDTFVLVRKNTDFSDFNSAGNVIHLCIQFNYEVKSSEKFAYNTS